MTKRDTPKPGQDEILEAGLEETKTINTNNIDKKENKKEDKIVPKVDVVKKIVELHNEGYATSKIGLILRDEYKIFNVKKYSGKTINSILKEHKLEHEIPEDLSDLLKRAVKLIKHMKTNKKDQTSKLGYQRTVSKIRRLAKYYKSTKKLPREWKYSEEQAAILVK